MRTHRSSNGGRSCRKSIVMHEQQNELNRQEVKGKLRRLGEFGSSVSFVGVSLGRSCPILHYSSRIRSLLGRSVFVESTGKF